MRIAVGFAWTTIVAAETSNGLPGIGGLAWATKKQLRTDVAILCVIVIGITALVLDLVDQGDRAARRPVEGPRLISPWTRRDPPSPKEHLSPMTSSRQPHGHRRPWLTALGLVAALTLVLAACGSSKSSTASSAETSVGASTATTAVAAPKKITIGYQQVPNGDLVVKQNKWLEETFPDTDIEWKLFDSGGSVNEAVVAGAVDIGLVGSSPASRGISTGIAYQVPWIFDVIGDAEALVVKSDITSIADLKGKTVATPFASTSHYSLLAALRRTACPTPT